MLVRGMPHGRRLIVALSLSAFIIYLFYHRNVILSEPAGDDASLDDPTYLPFDQAYEVCTAHGWKPYSHRSRRRKIYDMILVNTEIDWLEIRLSELWNEVDYFIILEAPWSFVGLPKPLHVQEHWSDFYPWHSKVIYHTLDETGVLGKFKSTWDHEAFQRNALFKQVLATLSDERAPQLDDVILVSDVDEIPRPSTVQTLRNCHFPRKLTLASRFYYYSFQWLHRGEEWRHPQATYYRGPHKTVLPEDLRRSDQKAEIFPNASWHCSSCLSTMEAFVTKITSFSHTKYNTPEARDRRNILKRVRNGLDLFDRKDEMYDRVEHNEDVPSYLQQQPQKFAYILNRDAKHGNFADYTESDSVDADEAR